MALNESGGFGVDLEKRMNRGPKMRSEDTGTYPQPDTHARTDTYPHTHPELNEFGGEYGEPEENKTTRMFLLVRPSVAEKIRTAAKRQRMSANELIHKLMEQYIDENNL